MDLKYIFQQKQLDEEKKLNSQLQNEIDLLKLWLR